MLVKKSIQIGNTTFNYLGDLLHCVNDLPAVSDSFGYKAYYWFGKLSRINGPAIIYPNGDKVYFLNGIKHRDDGPAVVRTNGVNEHWINGICCCKEDINV